MLYSAVTSRAARGAGSIQPTQGRASSDNGPQFLEPCLLAAASADVATRGHEPTAVQRAVDAAVMTPPVLQRFASHSSVLHSDSSILPPCDEARHAEAAGAAVSPCHFGDRPGSQQCADGPKADAALCVPVPQREQDALRTTPALLRCSSSGIFLPRDKGAYTLLALVREKQVFTNGCGLGGACEH